MAQHIPSPTPRERLDLATHTQASIEFTFRCEPCFSILVTSRNGWTCVKGVHLLVRNTGCRNATGQATVNLASRIQVTLDKGLVLSDVLS